MASAASLRVAEQLEQFVQWAKFPQSPGAQPIPEVQDKSCATSVPLPTLLEQKSCTLAQEQERYRKRKDHIQDATKQMDQELKNLQAQLKQLKAKRGQEKKSHQQKVEEMKQQLQELKSQETRKSANTSAPSNARQELELKLQQAFQSGGARELKKLIQRKRGVSIPNVQGAEEPQKTSAQLQRKISELRGALAEATDKEQQLRQQLAASAAAEKLGWKELRQQIFLADSQRGYFEMLAKLVAANSSGDCSTVLWVSLSDIARCEPPSLREVGEYLDPQNVPVALRSGGARFKFWCDLKPPFQVVQVTRAEEALGKWKEAVASEGVKPHPDGELFYVTYECPLAYHVERAWNLKSAVAVEQQVAESDYFRAIPDKDTSGLIVLTNDRKLNYAVTKSRKCSKRYEVTVKGRWNPADSRFQQLMEPYRYLRNQTNAGNEYWTMPAKVRILDHWREPVEPLQPPEVGVSWLMHHQIRRLISRSGLRLVHLHRVAVGPLQLRGLECGQARLVTAEELDELTRLCDLPRPD
ncbi:rsuA [Symbiodinium pilosum]|uniref:RsuA protein n=1 Tax=Symbiodinium pilosum TaxID=2952 RepID=A0A812IXY5_SYMPI|nr:rsuA [Symbiodinium pilosum]